MSKAKDRGFRLEFKLENMWIGIFWDRRDVVDSDKWHEDAIGYRVDVWVCLLPCLPFHFWWTRCPWGWKSSIDKLDEMDLLEKDAWEIE